MHSLWLPHKSKHSVEIIYGHVFRVNLTYLHKVFLYDLKHIKLSAIVSYLILVGSLVVSPLQD